MLKNFLFLISIVHLVTACSHVPGIHSPVVPKAKSQHTTVIMVPGSGSQNAAGLQTGDGFVNYARPIELGTQWKSELENAGYEPVAYDKRLGSSGPLSLAQDVDAACNAAYRHDRHGQKLVLWTSEQGTQVVLNSNCVKHAAALVIVSPIPDALDRVWVSGLREGGYRNRAESLSATFDSIRKGYFDPSAKIMGASLAFWKEWLALAQKTPAQLEALQTPVLFVVGENDVLLGRYGRHVLERIVSKNKNRKLIIIKNADRNLLQNESLSPNTVEIILRALGVLENNNG